MQKAQAYSLTVLVSELCTVADFCVIIILPLHEHQTGDQIIFSLHSDL